MNHFSGLAAIATTHAKGFAIGPILEQYFPIRVVTALGIDTDSIGTFIGEIARTQSAQKSAIEKARLALQQIPSANYGIGSVGSFGLSPYYPFASCGYEIIAMISRDESLQIFGHDITEKTNYSECIVNNLKDARDFAERLDFPSHAAIVRGVSNNAMKGQGFIAKGITSVATLERVMKIALKQHGEICIQRDMRANYNPTRMKSIQRATHDLVKNATSRCPNCALPGYVAVEHVTGLPCNACGEASTTVKELLYACVSCCYRETRTRPDGKTHLDPSDCCYCNP